MSEVLRREWIYLWAYAERQWQQIFPYWVVGMLLGSAVSVFAKGRIHGVVQALGRQRWGAWGVLPASALGIASPLCMYGTVPLAASLARAGLPQDWLAAFMMSSILLNPQLVMYSAALGGAALAVRVASCFLCGAAAGLLVRFCCKRRPFFDFTGFSGPHDRDTAPHLAVRFLKNFGRNIRATGPYFLAGVALSALFQRYVPTEFMTALFGGSEAFGVLMAATIGVPLYACGGGTIPLLAQWLADGMSLGAAAAFMLTGPATKLTNLGAVKIVLGAKHFLCYLAFVWGFALLAGLAVGLVV